MRQIVLLLAIAAFATAATWNRGDAYILHAGKTDVSMTNMSISELVARQHLGNASYLWARIRSHEYLIEDEGVLRDAVALWAPIEALKPEQQSLSDEEERLDARIDAIEDHEATASDGELERLRVRNEVVSRRQHELDEQEEAMEKVVEARLRTMIEDAIRTGRAKKLR